MEFTRSCVYNNVSLFVRPFGIEVGTRSLSEAWLTLAIFSVAIVYSIIYLGPWPELRDYVNIIDKDNWNLFGVYSLVKWSFALVLVPGIFYLLSIVGARISNSKIQAKEAFLASAGSLLPLGLFIWIAFVIPMLFVNTTFIFQSFSDPFGWGWDLLGAANTPWHQFLPQYIPWFQALVILTGFYLSLRNLARTWSSRLFDNKQMLGLSLPVAAFITSVTILMLLFFTN